LGIDAVYNNYELEDIAMLRSLVEGDEYLEGLNVTIPYKQAVIPLLDALDDAAQAIGAVNVIKIMRDESGLRMVGYNSDYIGFRNSIEPLLQSHHKHALVLGTGGAAKAVTAALKDLGLEVAMVSRSQQNNAMSYQSLSPHVMELYKVVVNATPLGMSPHTDTCPPIPYVLLTPQHLCYDVVYNPEQTLFMQRAAQYGAVVSNGMNMLYGQADAACEIWNI
jgi:shikimate dehydrogenase